MTTLILVRHGESEANRDGLFAGHYDVDLTERGLLQAQCAAEFLAARYPVSKVYASDLKRAYKTGKCTADRMGVPLLPEPALREIYAGAWEGRSFASLDRDFPESRRLWGEDIGSSRCPGGESVLELGQRIMNALTKIAQENDGETVVIATHATPVRAVQSIVKTGSVAAMQQIPWTGNASVTVLEYRQGGWRLLAEGITEHLASVPPRPLSNI